MSKSKTRIKLSGEDISDQEINEAYDTAVQEAMKPLRNLGVYAVLYHTDIQSLQGKILTLMDAAFSDKEQRKAVKDIIKSTIWHNWAENLNRVFPEVPVGTPIELKED